MTELADAPSVPELDGGPHDLEFFFDPGCPFAWQTSVWLRRVADLRDLTVGWRFLSLAHINAGKDLPDRRREAQQRSQRFLRICAAARERAGNSAVADLYRAYGERLWYTPSSRDLVDRFSEAAERVDPAAILDELGLPPELAIAADDATRDQLLAVESDEAFRRTGSDVGTPIITFGPDGGSFFGPVISAVPDDDSALAIYDAVRTLATTPTFSELKRSARPRLDLPLFS
jgi:hypothetical protein